ncbi:MAG: hypothetical protein HW389_2632 [Bacteroidetes bacterium]|nr:hypothetical protein [Bacteroidota bacterium]
MSRRIRFALAIILSTFVAGAFFFVVRVSRVHFSEEYFESVKHERAEDFESKWNQEFLMLRDPKTNKLPKNIFQKELLFANDLLAEQERTLGKRSALVWIERGPNNTSGRIRGFAIDTRTRTEPNVTIIAGGVSGGLWKSTNDGATWSKKTTSTQVHSITSVKQDTRSGKENTWYAGTGERIGNSASATGAEYAGNGVYKSTNNGETWSLLPSTVVDAPNIFKSDWQYVYRLDIDRQNSSQDEVYAATYGGIYRSTNGGGTWTQTLVLGNDESNSTDVSVTSAGVVYACGSKAQAGTSGIFRSTDGITWTDITPANYPANHGRMVLAVASSNENVVYVLVQGTDGQNGTNQVNNHQFWKYTYGSGDGSGANGTWVNRGANLPTTQVAGPADFDTQGGYDMLIAVKPDDENFVIFGGVNLYKTTDGLSSTANLAHIGGYGQETQGTANLLGDFINNHPDQHFGLFLPGSNVKFYNANDGGMHKAADIAATSNSSFWQTPRRAGFNITQPYALSIDPQQGSPIIAAGLQDRGNWVARTANVGGTGVNWQEATGGDGAVCDISADGWLYGSTSKGAIFRVLKTEVGEPIYTTSNTTFAQFKPAEASNQLFVTPFALDPNNPGILYYSGGKGNSKGGLWRSDDARTASESAGWTFLTSTQIAEEFVTAIGVSKEKNPNVVYYGTSDGKVFRIDSANSGTQPQTTDIWTNKGLPSGYVIRLAVDPTNSANVVLVFSNYNVRSVWRTADAGSTWADVSGNLEQNPDGSGSGPSVRWADIVYTGSSSSIFVSTSTGLYTTSAFNGASTLWTQEAVDLIGTQVCVMSDYRSVDGTFVVATHGRGVFQTTLETPPVANRAPAVQLLTISPNPAVVGGEVTLSLKPTDPDGEAIKVSVDWGDGATTAFGSDNQSGSTVPLKHTYAAIGSYKIKAKGRDARGLEGDWSAELSIEVRVASSVAGSADIPKRYELLANYPNPFNPSTMIRFGLPVSSHVVLKVYDVSGREVKTLLNSQMSAGFHSVNFDASGLSNGTYVYRIQANGFETSRKMMLVK